MGALRFSIHSLPSPPAARFPWSIAARASSNQSNTVLSWEETRGHAMCLPHPRHLSDRCFLSPHQPCRCPRACDSKADQRGRCQPLQATAAVLADSVVLPLPLPPSALAPAAGPPAGLLVAAS